MSTTKITPKPIVHSDKINKARDVSGLRKWARESRSFGRMIYVLGWFTIPAEVLLRHRFGRRWFTSMNFYVGAFLILIVGGLQYIADVSRHYAANLDVVWNPFYSGTITPAQSYYHGTREMGIAMMVYVLFGAYHLLEIWWRGKANAEIHSYDDGTPSLDFIGRFLMGVINALALPFIYIYMHLSLTKSERDAIAQPQLIDDEDKFTNTVIEPLFFLWAAYIDRHIIIGIWYAITAFAVAIHANMRETARKSKILDFKDSAIEAKAMRELRSGKAQAAKQPATKSVKAQAPAPSHHPVQHADLMDIIEEMNREGSHLAN